MIIMPMPGACRGSCCSKSSKSFLSPLSSGSLQVGFDIHLKSYILQDHIMYYVMHHMTRSHLPWRHFHSAANHDTHNNPVKNMITLSATYRYHHHHHHHHYYPQPTAMLMLTSTPTKPSPFRWRFDLCSMNVKQLTKQRNKYQANDDWILLSQHFFLKGWDEAREIHAYPPGKNIFIVTLFKTLMMTCLSSGEERSLQKIWILRLCRLCHWQSRKVLPICNHTSKKFDIFNCSFYSGSRTMPWALSSGDSIISIVEE